MSYKKPRTYVLTPSRKKLGKAVARRSRQTVARECFSEPITRAHLLRHIGMVIRNELKAMCSDKAMSILRTESAALKLNMFSWDKLLTELSTYAPVFLTLLHAATYTRRSRDNQSAVIGICAAVLLKHRFHKMNLVQKLLSLILYSGHSSKKVF